MSNPNDTPSLPQALISKNPLAWFSVFGPGAVVASLTIGTGELIFSSRGGALFGYRILFLFFLVSLLKWALVVGLARQFVLTGVHPYRRLVSVPGPRGWFVFMLFGMGVVCVPIWVSFHSGVVGNLVAWITGTKGELGGAVDSLWGAGVLTGILALVFVGGYTVLERVQIVIVATMLLAAGITLFLYDPDWIAMLYGAFVPQTLAYPDWVSTKYPQVAEQPIWVEATRYVGVIGGAGYDYLAYTSFLRSKGWGRSDLGEASEAELQEMAENPRHPTRLWLRAPLIDCSMSFLLVVGFSAVFVASGSLLLGPAEQIPDEHNLLNLQAQFVTDIHPWLLPLYVTGAFLAMTGSLYGTIEVGMTIYGESLRSLFCGWAAGREASIRRAGTTWLGLGAFSVLIWSFVYQYDGGPSKPPI
ncbi:MAG: Nramp family divalent metal transporter, partial [Planctomycetota bacterium]